MRDITLKKADTFLQTNHHHLQPLFSKLKILEELDAKVSLFFTEHLRKSCQVANLIGNQLILIVSSGSVATQLRFMVPELLQKFKHDPVLKKIQEIQCKVRPPQSRPKTNQPTMKISPLSLETAALIRDMAASMEDPKLKAIFMRLSEHTE